MHSAFVAALLLLYSAEDQSCILSLSPLYYSFTLQRIDHAFCLCRRFGGSLASIHFGIGVRAFALTWKGAFFFFCRGWICILPRSPLWRLLRFHTFRYWGSRFSRSQGRARFCCRQGSQAGKQANGRTAERQNGRTAERQNGRTEERKNGS